MKKLIKSTTPPIIWDLAKKVFKSPVHIAPEISGVQEFTCHGLKWRTDAAGRIAQSMLTTGTWEPATTALVLDMVKPGMNVLSVGANFGYYALLMANAVGKTGHVWAFEPTKKWRAELEFHVKINGFSDRITVMPFGLSDAPGKLEIQLSMQSASMHFWDGYSVTGKELIDVRRLDDVWSGKIDFISMDIDGHEPYFFRGAEKVLMRERPPIAMELSRRCMFVDGSEQDEARVFRNYMRRLGYELRDEATRLPWTNDRSFCLACSALDHDANVLAVPLA